MPPLSRPGMGLRSVRPSRSFRVEGAVWLTLLVSLSLSPGQSPSPPGAEPPPETTPPKPAAPDRWFLMRELQGTWPGWLLDGHKVQVTGWTEAAFTASSNHADQLPMGFNYRANELHV